MRLVNEEITFWRGFIEWWAHERKGPVPLRAWEALSYAEAKLNASTVSIEDLSAIAETDTKH